MSEKDYQQMLLKWILKQIRLNAAISLHNIYASCLCQYAFSANKCTSLLMRILFI